MKYVNGKMILPDALLNEIRKYIEGVYVYIPKEESKRQQWGLNTNFREEISFRNTRIYDNFLEGKEVADIASRYYLSIKSIRRIILQKKREMEFVKEMLKEVIKQWNLEGDLEQIYHSAWAIDNNFVMKEYKDKGALKRNVVMFKTLFDEGIPVPQIIQTTAGEDYYELDDKQYLLTTRLKGHTNHSVNMFDEEWFYKFGLILGKLHLGFQQCEKKVSFWNNSLLEEMNGWVRETLLELRPEYITVEDIENSIDELDQVYQDLPKQLIHRDVSLGNFLFDENEFSGYIDFDLSQSNIRIFDICYFLLGLLCEGNSYQIESDNWYTIVRQVIKGYETKVALSETERNSVTCVMKNIELLFIAYFLREGDEKLAEDAGKLFLFVRENEHFVI